MAPKGKNKKKNKKKPCATQPTEDERARADAMMRELAEQRLVAEAVAGVHRENVEVVEAAAMDAVARRGDIAAGIERRGMRVASNPYAARQVKSAVQAQLQVQALVREVEAAVDDASMAILIDMGFDPVASRDALLRKNGSVDDAIEWLANGRGAAEPREHCKGGGLSVASGGDGRGFGEEAHEPELDGVLRMMDAFAVPGGGGNHPPNGVSHSRPSVISHGVVGERRVKTDRAVRKNTNEGRQMRAVSSMTASASSLLPPSLSQSAVTSHSAERVALTEKSGRKMCIFFDEGYCDYGNMCKFLHGVNDVRYNIDRQTATKQLQKNAKVCKFFFSQGLFCSNGDECKFSHGKVPTRGCPETSGATRTRLDEETDPTLQETVEDSSGSIPGANFVTSRSGNSSSGGGGSRAFRNAYTVSSARMHADTTWMPSSSGSSASTNVCISPAALPTDFFTSAPPASTGDSPASGHTHALLTSTGEVGPAAVPHGVESTHTVRTVASEETECCVCLDAPRGCVLVPCGHTNMCMSCAEALVSVQTEQALCPSCREPVRQVFKAHI